MPIDWGLAIQLASYAVLAIGGWYAIRHEVQDARREAAEALRVANAAHARIDQHGKEVVDVRLDLREVKVKLDGFSEIRASLDRLLLAVKPKED